MTIRWLSFLLLVLLSLGARAADEPLPPEKAFPMSARALDAQTLEVRIAITDEYYLYKDKFRFSAAPAGVELGTVEMPAGKIHKDEFFGDVETYRGDLRLRVPLRAPAGVGEVELTVISQGCWDGGVCYPPLPQKTKVSLGAGAGIAGGLAALFGGGARDAPAQSLAPPVAPAAAAPAAALDDSARLAGVLRGASAWAIVATFFGAGLLLTFTPCVFPMIPILSSIIIGQGIHISRRRAFGLTVAYVLGMAVAYTIAGVLAGLSGTLLTNALQNPWVIGSFAVVFVLLALSMFGFYELQMPAALQSRLTESANRRGGTLAGVVLMGALSAIIVGPCVAAPLAGALLYIAQTGDAVLGGTALFFLALGMGVPLLIVGVSARHLLPKAGAWMEGVKRFFGVALLAVALWLVGPFVPGALSMIAWAALLILSAVFMHALDPLPAHAQGWHRFWKGVGVVALLTGASLLIGTLAGSRDPLQPLAVLRGVAAAPEQHVRFERVRSVAELDARLAAADRPVMLDFYADWCVSCKEMERFTFADAQVAARMGRMLLLQADVTANSADDQALLKRFGLFGPPGIIFFDARGREIDGLRVVGYQSAERFVATLERALDPALHTAALVRP